MTDLKTPDPEILEVLIKKIAAPIREHSMKAGRTPESKIEILNALACVAGMAIGSGPVIGDALEFFESAVRNQMARMLAEAIKAEQSRPKP